MITGSNVCKALLVMTNPETLTAPHSSVECCIIFQLIVLVLWLEPELLSFALTALTVLYLAAADSCFP